MAYVKTQFHKTVQTIRTDNGTEFVNEELALFLKSIGTVHHTTCPYTPQQNGRAERKHQHLLNIARALKFQSQLPNSFWGDFILTATHIINLLPSSLLHYKSPFEVLFNQAPDYLHLKSFGCLFYATNLNPTDKL